MSECEFDSDTGIDPEKHITAPVDLDMRFDIRRNCIAAYPLTMRNEKQIASNFRVFIVLIFRF